MGPGHLGVPGQNGVLLLDEFPYLLVIAPDNGLKSQFCTGSLFLVNAYSSPQHLYLLSKSHNLSLRFYDGDLVKLWFWLR